jgi:V8-like Glu-specific endopeptidase
VNNVASACLCSPSCMLCTAYCMLSEHIDLPETLSNLTGRRDDGRQTKNDERI